MKNWDEVAAKEGRLYCQTKDTWCALINMTNGSCPRTVCVNKEENKENEQNFSQHKGHATGRVAEI